MRNMLSKTRANWKSVKHFAEYYDLSKSHAYALLKEPEFPYMRTGTRNIRIDMNKTDKWFHDYFRR